MAMHKLRASSLGGTLLLPQIIAKHQKARHQLCKATEDFEWVSVPNTKMKQWQGIETSKIYTQVVFSCLAKVMTGFLGWASCGL